MENRPQVVLVSRLSTHGETLRKALGEVSSVKWIARRSEFKIDPVRFPLLLYREYLRLLAACRAAPRGKPPTVIVQSIDLDAIPAFFVRRTTGCRVVLYAWGPDVLGEKRVAQTSFLSWAVRSADAVLCANGRVEEEVRALGGTVTKVLPLPFMPFEPSVERRREFDVVTVGSLTGAANLSLLVEASAYLDPSVKIAVIGDGPQRQYLRELSRRHGRNQVFFLGDLPRKRIYRALSSSSLYVQCSPDGGSPSSVLEAASFGLPIIALNDGRNPGLTELYGLRPIVPQDGGAASLAAAIESAIQNYSILFEDVSKNIEAVESYVRAWPGMAASAIFA